MANSHYLFLLLALFAALQTSTSLEHNLYSKSFGDNSSPALIFLHGGPGYNSVTFELSTAEKLAREGYFVIVYDRRGEGRSEGLAEFSLEESISDLRGIYAKYKIKSATLLGHSFGGILATYFALQNPDFVENLVLISAPISLQESFKHIISTAKTFYSDHKQTQNLNYIHMLEKMDTTSLQYAVYSFMHAMQIGAYKTHNESPEAKKIYEEMAEKPIFQKWGMKMAQDAPKGFWENNQYTVIDLRDDITKIIAREINVYGVYGTDDGLYSINQIDQLGELIGNNNLAFINDASHSIFIDQQEKFIERINTFLNK